MRTAKLCLAMLILMTIGLSVSAAPESSDKPAETTALMDSANSLHERLTLAADALDPGAETPVGADALLCRTGVEVLRTYEAIRNDYVAGLTEGALIAYFNSPAQREKFDKYWAQLAKDWFDERMPPCRDFATWGQFREDRLWVKCAAAFLDDETARESLGPDGYLVFGADWSALKALKTGESLPVPSAPRRVNDTALEPLKHLLPSLFNKYSLNCIKDSLSKLRQKVFQETDDKLIHHQNGLRKKIFREYHQEAVKRLDAITADPDSLVRFALFKIAPDTLPGFDVMDLTVLSPTPTGTKMTIESSGRAVAVGDVTLDRGAGVAGTPCWSFQLLPENENSIRVYLDRNKLCKLMLAAYGITDLAGEVKTLRDKVAALDDDARAHFDLMLAEIDKLAARLIEK